MNDFKKALEPVVASFASGKNPLPETDNPTLLLCDRMTTARMRTLADTLNRLAENGPDLFVFKDNFTLPAGTLYLSEYFGDCAKERYGVRLCTMLSNNPLCAEVWPKEVWFFLKPYALFLADRGNDLLYALLPRQDRRTA